MRQANHYPVTGLLMSLMILGTEKGEQVSTRVKATLRPLAGQTADTHRQRRKNKLAAHSQTKNTKHKQIHCRIAVCLLYVVLDMLVHIQHVHEHEHIQ